jgi:serine/threonine-protein kinase
MERGPTSANPGGDTHDRVVGSLIADKYRVIRVIGSGSTGSVYLCEHVGLDRLVALKVLHREMERDSGFVQRFKREAKAASRLEHTNSVRILDFGQEQGGALYIVMEYIEGRDLLRVLDEDGPFSAPRAIDVMSQILDALSVAHSLGIVHRDLKPENVVLRSVLVDGIETELVTVCDFGIAQLSPIRLSGSSESEMVSISDVGMVVGTPAYMSPEQARAEPQDARSDIYSAGVVLFQLLTLQLPFTADTPLAVAVMHCAEPPPRPSQFGAVNPALEEICLKALSKTPQARYQSAREMRAALQRALQTTPRRSNRRSTPARWHTRQALPSAFAAAGLGAQPQGASSLSPVERISQPDSVDAGQRWRIPRPVLGLGLALVATAALPLLLRTANAPNDAEAVPPPSISQPTAASSTVAVARPPALEPVAAVGTSAPAQEPRIAVGARSAPVVSVGARSAPVVSALPRTEPLDAPSQRSRAPAMSPKHAADRSVAIQHPDKAPSAPAVGRSVGSTMQVEAQPVASEAPIRAGKAIEEPAAASVARTPPLNAVHRGAPSAPLSAAAPRPAAAAPVAPPAPAAAPATASVAVGPIAARAAVSKASVRGALNVEAITACYRGALRSGAAPAAPLSAQLELTTNMLGGIKSATLRAPALAESTRNCIEQVARRGRVREVDTGEAQATITLLFQPR